jgi:hypothetical protein
LIGARTALRRLAIMRAVFLFLFFRVAIAAVTIFTIHRTSYNMRQDSAWLALGCAEAHPYNGRPHFTTLLLRDLYPIGLLHSTVSAIFPRA